MLTANPFPLISFHVTNESCLMWTSDLYSFLDFGNAFDCRCHMLHRPYLYLSIEFSTREKKIILLATTPGAYDLIVHRIYWTYLIYLEFFLCSWANSASCTVKIIKAQGGWYFILKIDFVHLIWTNCTERKKKRLLKTKYQSRTW